MRTFAELLTEYMERIGISDSELARTLGVRRQTIFRWKEGLVEKPRYREDVLRCAAKLRLSPAERDELLLAAGFPPESAPVPPPVAAEEKPLAPTPPTQIALREKVAPSPLAPETQLTPAPPPKVIEVTTPRARAPAIQYWRARPTLTIALAAIAVLTLLIFAGNLVVLVTQSSPGYPVAAPGETLIVVAPFGSPAPTKTPTEVPSRRLPSESGEQPTYDVTSRIQAALEREVRAARLEHVRVATWHEPIGDAGAAEAVQRRAKAGVVIWGTSSDDSIVAALAVVPTASRADDMPLDALVAAPADAQMKIASAASEEIQALAVLTLSQLHLDRGDFGMARAALTQALSRPPKEPDAQATLNLFMGYVLQISKPPELGQAIQFYSQTIDLAPETPTAYFNRGIAYIRLNDAAQWQADFARVLALKPDHPGARQALCWAYALDQKPELALPHCDAAVRTDATARSREARGIVYAELGRLPEAAADLQAFCDWLARQPESLRARYGSSRADWVQSLKAGKNPIDDAALERLRRE
jgi:tetratricopeptide (TPR) repeat protein/transcriptional regulator with XRE-family HTH domain